MTLLRNKASRPGTHALVIGVGRYPWLVGGGKKPTFPENDGMAQLTSPPVSARAFADWLLRTYDNPRARLASLDLLLSDAKGQKFRTARGQVSIQPATFANVSKAIRDWAKRAKRPDDLLLFFFSGHGIAASGQTTLLCEDFGSDALAPLGHAVDFTKLRIGLDRVPPRQQLFFVDACRVATTTVLDTANFFGQPVIDPKAQFAAESRQAPVFQSTLAGQLADGQRGKPSYFTEALLRAFTGAATDNDDDGVTWWVQTDTLLRALPPLLRRVVEKPEQILPQAPASDLSRFPLHRLKRRPDGIPVDVSCTPNDRTAKAVLSFQGQGSGAKKRPAPSDKPWALDLPEGRYTFKAEFAAPAPPGKLDDEVIRPHYRNIRIPV